MYLPWTFFFFLFLYNLLSSPSPLFPSIQENVGFFFNALPLFFYSFQKKRERGRKRKPSKPRFRDSLKKICIDLLRSPVSRILCNSLLEFDRKEKYLGKLVDQGTGYIVAGECKFFQDRTRRRRRPSTRINRKSLSFECRTKVVARLEKGNVSSLIFEGTSFDWLKLYLHKIGQHAFESLVNQRD